MDIAEACSLRPAALTTQCLYSHNAMSTSTGIYMSGSSDTVIDLASPNTGYNGKLK